MVAPRTTPARDRGAAAVELVVVAPGLLFLVFFAVQAALFLYGRVVAEHAAREGVSVLRLAQDQAVADSVLPQVRDLVAAYARTVGREALLDPAVEPAYDDVAGTASVRVRGRVISLVPGLDLTVSQQVTGEVERFESDDRARP